MSVSHATDDPTQVAHGRRFFALWLGLSAIATPLVAIFLGPAIPPGNGSAQATEQVFDNQVMVSVVDARVRPRAPLPRLRADLVPPATAPRSSTARRSAATPASRSPGS